MYPLSDKALSLDALAQHWLREQPPGTSKDAVLNYLLGAFWLGKISFEPEGENFNQGRGNDRLAWLEILSRHSDHSEILFVAPGAPQLAIESENADGSVNIDIRRSIVWPPASDQDKDVLAETAYRILAEVPIRSYSPVIGPILSMQKISRTEFENFCLLKPHPLPAFWSSARSQMSPEVAERLCRKWFEDLVKAEIAQKDFWSRLPARGVGAGFRQAFKES